MADVVTLGECMALMVPPGVGSLRHQRTLELHVGGSEFNLAIGVSRLGGRSAWIGRVGDDEFGRLISATLAGEGVLARAVVDDRRPTAIMVKERRTAAVSRVVYYRDGYAGSRLRPSDLDESLIASAGVLHVTGITAALSATARDAVDSAVTIARDAGVPVSLDYNYRAALWDASTAGSVLRSLTARADIVFATEHEASLVASAPDAASLAAALSGLGPRQVLLKRGSLGAVAFVDGSAFDVPARSVTVVDPVGAGDAFAAAYLTAFIQDLPVAERLAAAAVAGAFAVMVPGDWEGLPLRSELSLLNSAADSVLR